MKNKPSFYAKLLFVFLQKSLVFTTSQRDKFSHFFQHSTTDQRTTFLIFPYFIDILHLIEKL